MIDQINESNQNELYFLHLIDILNDLLLSFRLVLEGKTGKQITELSRLEFFEKNLANNFAVSDAEHNISGKLNRGGKADSPFFKILLAIRQKFQKQIFWYVKHFFYEHVEVWQLQEHFCDNY